MVLLAFHDEMARDADGQGVEICPHHPDPMSTIFDHRRSGDGEHVGCIEMADDFFVPHDLFA
ncbi:hypothetical protein M3E72_010770 [Micrococcus luteus]|nr:hypothetical protein [Micrococcus luteus]